MPRTRRQLYLGRGAKAVTDRYERHEITAFLAEDTERLRRVLGAWRLVLCNSWAPSAATKTATMGWALVA